MGEASVHPTLMEQLAKTKCLTKTTAILKEGNRVWSKTGLPFGDDFAALVKGARLTAFESETLGTATEQA